MICVCLLCPHPTPKTPPFETVSDTQQKKLNGNLAKTMSELPYQSTFVFYSERRSAFSLPTLTGYWVWSVLSAPRPAPLAIALATPGMDIHYLMPDLAFISVASLQLCMPPLV